MIWSGPETRLEQTCSIFFCNIHSISLYHYNDKCLTPETGLLGCFMSTVNNYGHGYRVSNPGLLALDWLVGCFGFNGPLRQYVSIYRAVSQTERKRREKNVQIALTRTCCKRNRPFVLLLCRLVGRPRHLKLTQLLR